MDAGPRVALRLITSRSFGPYFAANALSASGGWFHNLAAALLVFRETGSEFLLGVLTFAQFIPLLVLVPWTGAAADRLDRRRLLLVTQLGATLLGSSLAVLTWLDLASAWLVIGWSLALGITSAFTSPAALALVPSLVEPEDVASAVGLNSMTYNVARAVGPALAAFVVATLGFTAAFAINAASYLALALGVLALRPRPQERELGPARLRESLALVVREPRLGVLLLVVMIVGFASDPINTLAPAFAEAFERADTDAGFVIGVFGAGAVTAAFALSGRVAGSRMRLAGMLALLGTGVGLFAVTPSLGLALPILFAGGFGYLAANTAATARLALDVAESQRGRIMALWTVAFLGLRPFASIADGAIAAAAGVRTAGVVLAAPALVAAAALYLAGRR